MRIIILGAGGHAQVVADILLHIQSSDRAVHPVGYLDDDPDLLGKTPLGLPVLGKIDELAQIEHDAVVVGIGNNRVRHRLYRDLLARGETFALACHPDAVIALNVSIGLGSVVCAGVVVNTGSRIGVNAILNTGCTVDHHNQIGDHAHIAPGVHLGGDVRIGVGTLVGIGATVIPQRSVGDWSVIGAGSVVTKNVLSGVVAVGTPARVIRKLEDGKHL